MKWLLRSVLISSLLAVGVYSFIFFSETAKLPSYSNQWQGYLLSIFLANIGSIGIHFLNLQFNKYLPWNERRGLRFLVELLSGLAVFLLLAGLFYILYVSPSISSEQKVDFWDNYWDGALKLIIILSVLIYIFSLVNFSMFSYNQYSVVQIELLQHERNQLKLQFQALKSQLNPHFLFNALNTISLLSSRDIQQAENYIRRLADTYQYILKTEDKKLVSLEEELGMLSSFFYMQQINYRDWISLKLNISPEVLQTYVPPLALQMLAENAIKHNLVDADKHLVVEVKADKFGISVINNCTDYRDIQEGESEKKEMEFKSYKIGLQNIEKRYKYFTKDKIKIEKGAFFIVNLPILFTGE
jgi:two-component system LytT family sensor kinase